MAHVTVVKQGTAYVERKTLHTSGVLVRQCLFDEIAFVPLVATNVFSPLLAIADFHEVELTRFQGFQDDGNVTVVLHDNGIEVVLANIDIDLSAPVGRIALIVNTLPELEGFDTIRSRAHCDLQEISVKIFPVVDVSGQDGELS